MGRRQVSIGRRNTGTVTATMADGKTIYERTDSETVITLHLLSAVEENDAVTQRSMAQELGIALGLANAYLKRCVRKGLIKVKQVPPNRYSYYLTPKGFGEKSKLTAQYLAGSFRFFRNARAQTDAALTRCRTQGWKHVALAGVGELAEITTLSARDAGVTLVGIVDAATPKKSFADLKVVQSLESLDNVDALIVTDLAAPQATYDALEGCLDDTRIITPELLGILRKRRPESDGK
jgi:DNA-binding MarR family transcriptional regulator